MHRLLFLIITFGFSVNALGFSLEGTWQEDKEKSTDWNSAYTTTDPAQLEKLSAIMGHMYLSYKDGVVCQFFEPYTINYNGKTTEISRLQTETYNYEIIAENKFGAMLKLRHSDGTESFTSLIFDNDTSHYGSMLTTEDYDLPGVRTYFKKISPVKWNYDCPN